MIEELLTHFKNRLRELSIFEEETVCVNQLMNKVVNF